MRPLQLTAVVAMQPDRGIGYQGKLLYRVKEDLQHFKRVTLGGILLMGRKTWDSLGGRPLPQRIHVVISRHPMPSTRQVVWVPTPEAAYAYAYEHVDKYGAFVVGGGEIYRHLLPQCTQVIATHFRAPNREADCFFPDLPHHEWESRLTHTYNTTPSFHVVTYRRRP